MNIPLKKTVLKVHPLFPALFLFSFFTGKQSVLFTLLALLLHESGHLLVLRLFHLQPSQISLTPFGGLITAGERKECLSGRILYRRSRPSVQLARLHPQSVSFQVADSLFLVRFLFYAC